jgi:hypothetical protein
LNKVLSNKRRSLIQSLIENGWLAKPLPLLEEPSRTYSDPVLELTLLAVSTPVLQPLVPCVASPP